MLWQELLHLVLGACMKALGQRDGIKGWEGATEKMSFGFSVQLPGDALSSFFLISISIKFIQIL